MEKIYIGMDVGGTNVKLGMVDAKGKVFARSSFSTKGFTRTPKTLIEAMCQAVEDLLVIQNRVTKDVAGVGIGLPGLIDVNKGIVRMMPNIKGWKNVPLKKIMQQKLRTIVQLENDVNMITLGEWKYGAAKGKTNFICITLGTGVGGGLVMNGQLFRGAGFAAGELGHVPLNQKGPKCGCGGFACFEQYVGNVQLQKKAAQSFKNPKITLEEVSSKANAGVKKALKFWEMVGELVGQGLIGPINILNPECVVIGGGVSRSLKFLKPGIEKVIHARCMTVQADMVKIIKASLGDDAGIAGARVLIGYEEK